jgi:hypothetical protein
MNRITIIEILTIVLILAGIAMVGLKSLVFMEELKEIEARQGIILK